MGNKLSTENRRRTTKPERKRGRPAGSHNFFDRATKEALEVAREYVRWAWRHGVDFPEIGTSVGSDQPTPTYAEACWAVAEAWRALPANP
jgi:hypothetical protein